MAKKKYQLRITIYGYDVAATEEATEMVMKKILQLKLIFSLFPPPVKTKTVTTLISPHKHKTSQEQFTQKTHRRVIHIFSISPTQLESLEKLRVPQNAHLEAETFL